MLRKLAACLAFGLFFSVAQADTLLVENVRSATASQMEKPARGISKAQVEARFGSPLAMIAAVGEPPISRWEYAGFVVYFEHDHVIHAVVKH